MKNKFLCILFLAIGLVFISGCGNDNFFDVQSAMNPPRSTQKQEGIKNALREHFSEDFVWEYPLISEKYSPVTEVNLTGSDEVYQLVFCQISGETHKIHMLILKQNQSKWEVVEDIAHTTLNIEKACIQDIDKDGINEIVIYVKNFDSSYNSVYAYKYSDNHLSEVAVPSNFLAE